MDMNEMDDNRKKWLEERQKGLGASDASSVMGMSKYKTNVQLWEEKTGRTIPEDISHKPFVKYGIESEYYLRGMFRLDYPRYQTEYEQYKIYNNVACPYIMATLDGKIKDLENGEQGILEIKTCNIQNYQQLKEWEGKIPQMYYVQALHQLLATGFAFVMVKVQLKLPTSAEAEVKIEIRHYKIKAIYVMEDMEVLRKELIEFWGYIQRDERPPLKLPSI